MEKTESVIVFKNPAAACVFANEIKGQISDGMWENTRPLNHWEWWCGLKVEIGDANRIVSATHPSKKNYALHSLLKNEVVTERIERMVRFAKSKWFKSELLPYIDILTESCYLYLDDDGKLGSSVWKGIFTKETREQAAKRAASSITDEDVERWYKIYQDDLHRLVSGSRSFFSSLPVEERLGIIDLAKKNYRLRKVQEAEAKWDIDNKRKNILENAGITEETVYEIRSWLEESSPLGRLELAHVLDEVMSVMHCA